MSTVPFDKQTAIFLAAVCGQTYVQYDNKNGAFVVPRGYETVGAFNAVVFNDTSEVFGFVLESAEHVLVAFRGTASTADWISDAIARQNPFPFVRGAGLTHTGITKIYASSRKRLLTLLGKLPPRKKLMIAGHSLGGALATLLAIDAAANTPYRSPRLYTYGSPRVGNPAFANAFRRAVADSQRIHNVFDLVTQLPPLVYKSPKTGVVYRYMHVQRGYLLSFQKGSVSANHKLDNYYTALAGLAPAYARELARRNPGLCPE